tara:strand:+ start:4272 stop:4520 length:249 start_codon:yes stop_codon:yes gene_type:complete
MPYEKSIEEGMIEAEACVNHLEEDTLSLSEALSEYKKGIELLHFCDIKLNNTKQQIQMLDYSTGQLIDVNPESVTGPIDKKS